MIVKTICRIIAALRLPAISFAVRVIASSGRIIAAALRILTASLRLPAVSSAIRVIASSGRIIAASLRILTAALRLLTIPSAVRIVPSSGRIIAAPLRILAASLRILASSPRILTASLRIRSRSVWAVTISLCPLIIGILTRSVDSDHIPEYSEHICSNRNNPVYIVSEGHIQTKVDKCIDQQNKRAYAKHYDGYEPQAFQGPAQLLPAEQLCRNDPCRKGASGEPEQSIDEIYAGVGPIKDIDDLPDQI